jgi:hypothetical protein
MERCEGVDGAAVQDPCDMAKTGLFEAQFPAGLRQSRHVIL